MDGYDDIGANKQLALLQREVAMGTKKVVMDEMSHAARWIMASVLAINSGGLIAAINRIEALGFWSTMAVIAFYAGVALALKMGWRQISLNQRMLAPHSRFIAVWESAAIDGQIDGRKLEEVRDEIIAVGTQGIAASTLGRWSFALFTLGLLCLALSTPETAEMKQQEQVVAKVGDS
ncbi:hypothetical protein [Erythrobacter mangrovi]|uniref:SLATT domain-containing protein n=1 Tax=Erythrobacter mangrovi TaxID=2739433 RepID=A0A7D3XAF6_9SPHN|nr:hypothetical protein [Erythrobacter mangrovi]QKG70560.1 hypothetical protein HQR01_03805 [Erythrobacter mangrovi]